MTVLNNKLFNYFVFHIQCLVRMILIRFVAMVAVSLLPCCVMALITVVTTQMKPRALVLVCTV